MAAAAFGADAVVVAGAAIDDAGFEFGLGGAGGCGALVGGQFRFGQALLADGDLLFPEGETGAGIGFGGGFGADGALAGPIGDGVQRFLERFAGGFCGDHDVGWLGFGEEVAELAAEFANSVVLLRDGALLGHGDPQEMTTDAMLAELYAGSSDRVEAAT